ncbi:unnamed protein product [Musa acuminata subsp. malaccensis]|uniref:(wild Malaysian banana) hypothetical protein n=1 Tax=Musa acuminata subsp. malaccensis TaxID=214687 RepID=A0A804J5J0_MUSAM|nr:unnamed protein product [Musa acuminata subsp. malaccensis]
MAGDISASSGGGAPSPVSSNRDGCSARDELDADADVVCAAVSDLSSISISPQVNLTWLKMSLQQY